MSRRDEGTRVALEASFSWQKTVREEGAEGNEEIYNGDVERGF